MSINEIRWITAEPIEGEQATISELVVARVPWSEH